MQFKDVLASPELKHKLINQVHENRISHAQFFLAQPGSHAFALAVALAQYLCCEHPTDGDSCGTCPSCVQFSKLAHPDLHIYFPNCITKDVKKDPESGLMIQTFKDFAVKSNYHIEIEDWIALLEAENKQPTINIRDCANIVHINSMRSYMGGYKIYILWCADRLYHDAAPKLLKTLEEPESKSLFILISEKPDQILSTILSRTQMVKIPKLTDDEIFGELKKDFPNMDDTVARDIAIVADGDYNKALKIHEDNSDVKTMLDAFALMMSSAVSLSRQQPLAAVRYDQVQECFEKIIAQGREYQKSFLNQSLRMLRNMLMININHATLIKVTEQENFILQTLQDAIGLKQVSKMTEEINKALYHISRNGSSALIFTDLYFKIAESLK